MEPRVLMPLGGMLATESKDCVPSDLAKAQQALSELSLNSGTSPNPVTKIAVAAMTPLQRVSLQLARRKSLQHVPVVSSPLTRKVWSYTDEGL